MSSNSVRSFVKPALHEGEQIGGGVGWRACVGSGGMAGACTTGAGKDRDPLAQPLASSGSSNSISARTRQFRFGFINDPLQRFRAPLFFGPGLLLGFAGGPFQFRDLLGVRRPGVGMGLALDGEAMGLQRREDQDQRQRRGQPDDGSPGNHSQPRYLGERTFSTSWTWCRLMSHALRVP